MAKKRVEQKTEMAVDEQPLLQEGEMMIDDSFDIPMKQVEMHVATKEDNDETPREKPLARKSSHTVNCLRNEQVIVRFIPS